MRIIDFENHFCTQAWVDAVSAKKEGYPRLMNAPDGMLRMYYTADVWVPFQAAKLGDLGAQRIELMDQAGVDVAVLSLATPGTDPFEPSLGTQIAKKTNDFLAEAIGKYPDRYMGYACLAPKDIDSAVNELERCVKEFGFVGWNAHSNFGDSYLDEKRYWPLLAKAEELGVPIFIHPAVSIIPQFRTYGMGLAGPTFGFGAETAMVMMRLIVSGALDAFPKLTIILGHYGEGLPFMMDRVNRDYVQGHVRPESSVGPPLKRLPGDYLKENMFVSTSGNYADEAFVCTKHALGIHKMVLGTDYPYEDMRVCMDFLEGRTMTADEKEQLYTKTAGSFGVSV